MSRLDALEKSNEQAMATFSDEVVAKLGRLEQYVEKTVRTHNDEMEKRLKEEQGQIGSLRLLLIILFVVNLAMAAGIFMIWSGSEPEEPAPVEQLLPDSTAVPDGGATDEAGGKKGKTR